MGVVSKATSVMVGIDDESARMRKGKREKKISFFLFFFSGKRNLTNNIKYFMLLVTNKSMGQKVLKNRIIK